METPSSNGWANRSTWLAAMAFDGSLDEAMLSILHDTPTDSVAAAASMLRAELDELGSRITHEEFLYMFGSGDIDCREIAEHLIEDARAAANA